MRNILQYRLFALLIIFCLCSATEHAALAQEGTTMRGRLRDGTSEGKNCEQRAKYIKREYENRRDLLKIVRKTDGPDAERRMRERIPLDGLVKRWLRLKKDCPDIGYLDENDQDIRGQENDQGDEDRKQRDKEATRQAARDAKLAYRKARRANIVEQIACVGGDPKKRGKGLFGRLKVGVGVEGELDLYELCKLWRELDDLDIEYLKDDLAAKKALADELDKDPPRMDYYEIAVPTITETTSLEGATVLHQWARNQLTAQGMKQACLQAYLTTYQRHQGAQIDGNAYAMVLQRRTMIQLAQRATAYAQDAFAHRRDLDFVFFEHISELANEDKEFWAGCHRRLQEFCLSPKNWTELEASGLDAESVEEIKKELLELTPEDLEANLNMERQWLAFMMELTPERWGDEANWMGPQPPDILGLEALESFARQLAVSPHTIISAPEKVAPGSNMAVEIHKQPTALGADFDRRLWVGIVRLNSPETPPDLLSWRCFGMATEADRAAFPGQMQDSSARLRDESDGLMAPALPGKYEIRIYTGGLGYRIVDRRPLIVERTGPSLKVNIGSGKRDGDG